MLFLTVLGIAYHGMFAAPIIANGVVGSVCPPCAAVSNIVSLPFAAAKL